MHPSLQSILGDQGRIVSQGNQLVINAPAPQVEEIRQLVQQLDTEPQMLLISIDRTGMAHSGQDSIKLGGSFSVVDGHRVIIDLTDQREITRQRQYSQQQGIELVRTLEGSAVLISQQQQHPITHSNTYPMGLCIAILATNRVAPSCNLECNCKDSAHSSA